MDTKKITKYIGKIDELNDLDFKLDVIYDSFRKHINLAIGIKYGESGELKDLVKAIDSLNDLNRFLILDNENKIKELTEDK